MRYRRIADGETRGWSCGRVRWRAYLWSVLMLRAEVRMRQRRAVGSNPRRKQWSVVNRDSSGIPFRVPGFLAGNSRVKVDGGR